MLHDSMKEVNAQRTKSNLESTIAHAEKMIQIYSERDRESMAHYEEVKRVAELKLLNIITEENEAWLKTAMLVLEA